MFNLRKDGTQCKDIRSRVLSFIIPTSTGSSTCILSKRNLISGGGCADTLVNLVVTGNADGNHTCLGNGKSVLMRTPTQDEFVECWSEVIIRNGLPPALVDDPLFRKTLVTTSRMGQTTVCMGKGTVLGKRDTTLPHRQS